MSSGVQKNSVPPHEQLYRDATQALAEGHQDKALQLLDASARANPAYAEPWVKMAQIYFDASNYPMAIKAADEATKRDPARRETKAISVVASLRVAMNALSDMREDANLRGNTRAEAEKLARTLRETLSIEQIVPPITGADQTPPQAAAQKEPAAPPQQAAAPKPSPHATSHRPARPSKPAPEAEAGNPFKVLK